MGPNLSALCPCSEEYKMQKEIKQHDIITTEMKEQEKERIKFLNDSKVGTRGEVPPELQDYLYTEIVDVRKEDVKTMKPDLINLQRILKAGFKKVDQVKFKNIILVIGNTGCGKSTILNSMILGAEKLEFVVKKVQIVKRKKGK